jgi:hypothetical protein
MRAIVVLYLVVENALSPPKLNNTKLQKKQSYLRLGSEKKHLPSRHFQLQSMLIRRYKLSRNKDVKQTNLTKS